MSALWFGPLMVLVFAAALYFALLNAAVRKPPQKPWLVDREGVVYKPEKRVVLKAKDRT